MKIAWLVNLQKQKMGGLQMGWDCKGDKLAREWYFTNRAAQSSFLMRLIFCLCKQPESIMIFSLIFNVIDFLAAPSSSISTLVRVITSLSHHKIVRVITSLSHYKSVHAITSLSHYTIVGNLCERVNLRVPTYLPTYHLPMQQYWQFRQFWHLWQ